MVLRLEVGSHGLCCHAQEFPELQSSLLFHCLCQSYRGVASMAYAAGAGSSGLVYSVGADCMVCALDAATGAEVMKFKAGSHALTCVGASPDCQSVLVGSSSLALWSLVRQKRLAKFMGHTVRTAIHPGGLAQTMQALGLPHTRMTFLEFQIDLL